MLKLETKKKNSFTQVLIIYIFSGESFLKCYFEYAITSGVAISVSTNATTTILSKIADSYKTERH